MDLIAPALPASPDRAKRGRPIGGTLDFCFRAAGPVRSAFPAVRDPAALPAGPPPGGVGGAA
jgi:hypothetical protein